MNNQFEICSDIFFFIIFLCNVSDGVGLSMMNYHKNDILREFVISYAMKNIQAN